MLWYQIIAFVSQAENLINHFIKQRCFRLTKFKLSRCYVVLNSVALYRIGHSDLNDFYEYSDMIKFEYQLI